MADLFELSDLEALLRDDDYSEAAATVARRVASGWLRDATRLAAWPDPVPDDLWSWAIELAGIAYRNPDGKSSEAIDDYRVNLDRTRRTEILNTARASEYAGGTNPQYSFPEPDWHWTAVPSTSAE